MLLVDGLDRLVSKALVNLLHKLRPPLYTRHFFANISISHRWFLLFLKRSLITVCIVIPLYYKSNYFSSYPVRSCQCTYTGLLMFLLFSLWQRRLKWMLKAQSSPMEKWTISVPPASVTLMTTAACRVLGVTRVTPVPVSNFRSLPRTQHDMTVQGKILTGPIQSKQSLKLGS